MINISFISTLAYNYFFPGKVKQAGGHTRFYNLARRFAERPDYNVTCIVGDFGQEKVVEKYGIRIVKAPIDNPASFFNVLKILKNEKSDVYLDFCASPRLCLLDILKKMTGCRYVFFTGHDNDVNGKYKDIENLLFNWVYIYGLRRADSIICQVPDHVTKIKNRYGLNSEFVLSPYFDILPKKLKTIEKKYILWVGRSAHYKNPDAFVDLAERFPDNKFVMICNYSKYDHGFMTGLKQRLKKILNLRFVDYVPYPEMEKYYEQTKLLVNTSEFEGFPNTFIEAAMHSTPILSLNVNPNEMLSYYNGGICCDGNWERFIESFSYLVGNEQKLAEYGRNAYDYAEKNHQLKKAVEKIDGIIKAVVRKE